MTLVHILVFAVVGLLVGWLAPPRARSWVLLATSLAAVYWLQPSTPIRNLDFWFPTASIALTVFVWSVTRPAEANDRRSTLWAASVILGIVFVIGLTRYVEPLCCLTASRPPELPHILMALGLAGVLVLIPYQLLPNQRYLPAVTFIAILLLFLLLKTETLARASSAWLRLAAGQSTELASAADLPWLGFSYLAFRLLHVLRDHQAGKLPAYSLGEFVIYAIFPPTYTAGPIDRSQRFINDLRKPVFTDKVGDSTISAPDVENPHFENIIASGQRILWGVFKKFVLADSLALVALNSSNASQLNSTLWAWVLLYAYTLRIYFDFSGYTDIAIGLGRLMGFNLPENFDRPYLKQNLTAFWNSWHITLAQWFRAYFFNPFTRFLRMRPQKLPVWIIILISQLATMLLIGLWHGVSWGFVAWGAWHGLGLFAHNRWSGWVRPGQEIIDSHPNIKRLVQISSWFFTFNYVALGWVWFALPNLGLAREVFLKLFGINF